MKQMTFFSRGDYLATKLALVVVSLVYPALMVVPDLVGWVGQDALVVPGHTTAGVGPAVETAPGLQGRYTDAVLWTIVAPSPGQRLVALLPAVMVTVLLAIGAVVLWRLVSVTQRGVPFDRRAVRQLRVLGVLVMAYGILPPVGEMAAWLVVFWSAAAPSIAFGVDVFDLFPFVVGSLVLVVAECFRIGLRLSDDTTGLV